MAKRKKKSVVDDMDTQASSLFDKEKIKEQSEPDVDGSKNAHPEFDMLLETAKGVVHDVKALLQEELVKNPYKTLGVALSVGYMLGGGSSKVRRSFLFSMVGRMVAKSAFRRLLLALAQHESDSQGDDMLDEEDMD